MAANKTITVNGKKYLKDDIISKCSPVVKSLESLTSIGQKFEYNNDIYILAQVDSGKLCLLDLESGNRWDDPIKVERAYNVRPREWKRITSGKKFTRVKTNGTPAD